MPELDDSRKQAEWDRRCAVAPRCRLCRNSVLRHGDTYHEMGDTILCANCFPIVKDLTEEVILEFTCGVSGRTLRHIESLEV